MGFIWWILFVFCFLFFQTESYSVGLAAWNSTYSQAGLKLVVILLPLPRKSELPGVSSSPPAHYVSVPELLVFCFPPGLRVEPRTLLASPHYWVLCQALTLVIIWGQCVTLVLLPMNSLHSPGRPWTDHLPTSASPVAKVTDYSTRPNALQLLKGNS